MLRTLRPTSQVCHENRWLEWLEWLDANCEFLVFLPSLPKVSQIQQASAAAMAILKCGTIVGRAVGCGRTSIGSLLRVRHVEDFKAFCVLKLAQLRSAMLKLHIASSLFPLWNFDEETGGTGQFCWNMPKCVIEGSPKINYVAAYQFDGEKQTCKKSCVFQVAFK